MIQLDCDAVLFDLDGVLIDSTSCITRHWQEWARQHGLEMATVMDVAHGLRTVETMRLVAPQLNVEREAELFTAAEVMDTEGVVAIEGALPLLKGLPEDAWAIVTSGSNELAVARLNQAGLPVPKILVSGDDVAQGKPAPEPYLVGSNRLGMTVERCVVIEDSPAGIKAARAAEMQVIGITTTHSREELDCRIVVDRLSALQSRVGGREKTHLLIQIEEMSGDE